MSQLQLNRISQEIIDHTEKAVVPDKGLSKVVDDYFIQRLKQEEMQHAEVDTRLYEGLRRVVQAEGLPLFEQYRQETARCRDRRQKRKLWQYVLGTVGIIELLGAVLTRGRSLAPQVLIPTVIVEAFIGFILYTAAQYLDDLYLARARKRLEKALELLEAKVQTDADYDNRRELMDNDMLRGEALEVLTQYEKPADFWRDYQKVRTADPTAPSELAKLGLPAFDRFLKFHVDGRTSTVARQHRFNRLFIEAHEIFVSRDRDHYVENHLQGMNSKKL
jgi:hypothetical protein